MAAKADVVQIGTLACDAAGRIMICDAPAARLLGRSSDHMLRRPLDAALGDLLDENGEPRGRLAPPLASAGPATLVVGVPGDIGGVRWVRFDRIGRPGSPDGQAQAWRLSDVTAECLHEAERTLLRELLRAAVRAYPSRPQSEPVAA
ncbi:MAG TPA: hypothetical protein VF495_07850 [Phenylobacterium sp.]